MNNELVTVARFETEGEATLLKLALAEHGIVAVLADNNISNAHGLISVAIGWVKVQVAAVHEARARKVIAETGCGAECLERSEGGKRNSETGPVEAECESCGKRSTFPASKKGKVDYCPKCGDYVDVPD